VVVQSNGIAWEASLDEARERAHREGKALLLDFRTAPPTPTSLAVDNVTYLNPRVVAFIRRHVVPVMVVSRANPAASSGDEGCRAPIVIVGDGEGGPHYRVEGFLSPVDFIAQLGLGLGRYRFDRHEYAEAIRHFEEVADRHEDTQAAAQALFWLGVARYKQSTEPSQTRSNGEKLLKGGSVSS